MCESQPADPSVETRPGDSLAAAMARHDIHLPKRMIDRLDDYCRLLWEMNQHLNLTRHTDYERFVSRDLVDSLALAEFIEKGEKILDVGTGGGVPGIVLAIVRPDLKVILCESVAKKAAAVGQIVEALNLKVPVVHGRAEQFLAGHPVDTLVIRAVARIRKILDWFRPRWQRFGRILLIKGPAWVEERNEVRHFGLMDKLALRRLKSYPLPGTDSESVVLQICPKDRLDPKDNTRVKKIVAAKPAGKPGRRPGGKPGAKSGRTAAGSAKPSSRFGKKSKGTSRPAKKRPAKKRPSKGHQRPSS